MVDTQKPVVIPAPALRDLRLHGEPAHFSMLAAETEVGPISFELIQPLTGTSPYSEWLESHGEGLHHVACGVSFVEELREMTRTFEGQGIGMLTEGRLDELEFCYFDSKPTLKVILETGAGGELGEPLRIYPPHAAD